MTTRFHVGMFDDAAYHLLHAVFGWAGASDEEGKIAWVDVRHLVEYRAEVRAGNLLEIHACLRRIGTKSITVFYEMTNVSNHETAATMEVIYVLFDMQQRKGIELAADLREKALLHLIEPKDS